NADLTRLAQVFSNLLNNAAKFTSPGGNISLAATLEDGQTVVRVCDTGAGIPAEVLPHVFELFVQADPSPERSHGGLGIGLTLVQRLVQMHGGTAEAHSGGLGQGSEFVVRLPVLGTAAEPAERPTEKPPAKLPAMRILIIDDNQDSSES